jgi:DNA-directed RNA polymerase specialized sigma24 family protein
MNQQPPTNLAVQLAVAGPPDDQKTRILAMFAAGKTVNDIARLERIPASDVARIVRRRLNRLTPARVAKKKARVEAASSRPTDQGMPAR